MTCAEAERVIYDSVAQLAGARALSRLQTHVQQCANCQRAMHTTTSLWKALRESRLRPPDPATVRRIRTEVLQHQGVPLARAFGRTPRSFSITGRVVSMSATMRSLTRMLGAAAIGIVATLLVLRLSTPVPAAAPTTAHSDQHEFMLFLLTPTTAPAPSPSELHQIVSEHRAWAEKLRAEGRLVIADKLTDDDGKSLPAAAAVVATTVPTERVGGFFLIRARDYGDAMEIAKDGPTLRYGGRIEVRQIDNPS
jgi:hypothetical protein